MIELDVGFVADINGMFAGGHGILPALALLLFGLLREELHAAGLSFECSHVPHAVEEGRGGKAGYACTEGCTYGLRDATVLRQVNRLRKVGLSLIEKLEHVVEAGVDGVAVDAHIADAASMFCDSW